MLNYLCFTAQTSNITLYMYADGTPTFVPDLEYSYNGSTWYTFTPGSTTVVLSYVGRKVYFRGDNETFAESYNIGYRFATYNGFDDRLALSGNVMSLLDRTCESVTINRNYCFRDLFFACGITSAPELPATSLAPGCYESMFSDCEYLTSAPELPATYVPDRAYAYMFQWCYRLTTPPILPATTVGYFAYAMMFKDCTSLTTPPELPATTIDAQTYDAMFYGCTSLTTVPQLPARSIGRNTYYQMFYGCSSLKIYSSSGSGHTKAWKIPFSGNATGSITQGQMFYGTSGDYATISSIDLNNTFYTQNDPIPIYYTLTFDRNGHGSAPSAQTVKNGSYATEPSNPTASGYTFGGWYNEAACTTAFSFSTPITADKTIYAKWSINTYTLTYNLDGGTADNPSTYTVETSAFTLNNPTKSGYTFTGWTGTGLSSKKMTVTVSKGSTGNRTYTANYGTFYTVTFNMQGHGTQVASQTIEDGNTATEPTAPTATGYTFGGWYNESSCTTAFSFSTPITADKTLYAKWTADTYTITYNLDGGTATNPSTYTIETPAFTLNNPTKSNMHFDGWTGTGLTEETTTVTIPLGSTGNRSYTANYSPYVTVSFNMNGHGTQIESQTIVQGATATKPSTPTATGWFFNAWYSDSGLTTAFDFSTPITQNTTLYAKWAEIQVGCNVWYFNSSISISDSFTYITPFISYGTAHTQISSNASNLSFDSITVYNGSWVSESYRTVIFKDSPSGALLTWLQANAIEITYGAEVWYWNDMLSASEIGDINFVGDGVYYTNITGLRTLYDGSFLGYVNSEDREKVYSFRNNAWLDDKYRTMVLQSELDDEYIADFIRENAVKVSQGISCTVSFNMNGHGTQISPQTVIQRGTATRPTNPTSSGLSFNNWYTDDTLQTVFDFSTPIMQDTTLWARWVDLEPTYTLTFDMQGHGTAPSTQTVKFLYPANGLYPRTGLYPQNGGSFSRPTPDPSEAGWIFNGWYTDATYSTEFDFTLPVTTSRVAYAKWGRDIPPHTVSFDMHGHGTQVSSQSVVDAGTATRPSPDPTASGWAFVNWYEDSSYTTVFDFSTPIYDDTTIHAKWLPKHTVSFNMGGHGTAVPSQEITDGETATRPSTDPTDPDWHFVNWYTDNTYTTLFNFSTPITEDTTIYAKWLEIFTVSFNMHGHGTAVPSQNVIDGNLATRPATDPTASGWTFVNWYADSSFTEEFDFTDPITADTVIHAKWLEIFTVSFVMNGHGTQVPAQYITDGQTATRPATDPTATGWVFSNWYADSALQTVFDFTDPITQTTTIYAKWLEIVTVSFDMKGHGTQIAPIDVVQGQTVTRPTDPTASRWIFNNWYSDTGLQNLFDFSTPIDTDTTLYAKWTEAPRYTVAFNLNGAPGSIPSQTIYSGELATKPTDPIRSEYTFEGWFTEFLCINEFIFSTPITGPTMLYAKWKKNKSFTVIDWTKSMSQTYEFYIVDPSSWKDDRQIFDVESCTINRDLSTDTLGSATFECTEVLEECYIRVYMIAKQENSIEKVCLGTFLVQTPSIKFDGKRTTISMDGYTPLIELKNSLPSIGYTIRKWDQSTNNFAIMNLAYNLCLEHMRAPVVPVSVPTPIDDRNKLYAHFMANPDDTWFSYLSEFIAQAKYSFLLEPEGRVLFNPITSISALQPVWIYNDDNSSILLPEVTDERDLYGVPNVVEVVYSTDTKSLMARVENNDPNSPVSIQNRGREVVYRDTDPGISDNMGSNAAQQYLEAYAETLLKKLSTLEHTVTYSHGYCPVRIGDGVMLNYKAAGLNNVKAEVISQSFDCKAGCTVEETAMYTTSLLGDNIDTKRKIKYISLYGTTPRDKTVGTNYNLTSADLPALSAAGHTWGGWYKDGKYTTQATTGLAVDQNLTLFAKWT